MGMHFNRGVPLDRTQDRQTVHLRHLEVQENDGRRCGLTGREAAAAIEVIERLLAVVDHHDVIREAIVGERLERQLHVVRVVLDEEYVLQILHGVPSSG